MDIYKIRVAPTHQEQPRLSTSLLNAPLYSAPADSMRLYATLSGHPVERRAHVGVSIAICLRSIQRSIAALTRGLSKSCRKRLLCSRANLSTCRWYAASITVLESYTRLLCQPRHLPVSPQTVMRQPRPKHHPLLPKKAKKPQAEDVEEEEEMDDSQVNVGSFRYAAAGEGTKGVQCTYIDVSIGLDRMIASVWPK